MCDSKCRAKCFKFFDIAPVVSEEGGAAHTVNLCNMCYNERRAKQGEAEVAASKWRALTSRRLLEECYWTAFGLEQSLRETWERFTIKKAWARLFLEGAENLRRLGNRRHVATRDAVQGGARACAAQQ